MHKLTTARDAGNIIRYHGWPTIKEQTNASHTWNVLRIYYEQFGWPSHQVAAYIQYHDVGELATGDVSFVVKREHPEVKVVLGPIEDAAMESLSNGYVTKDMITGEEKIKVKICDLMEMLEFSLDEMRLGSRHYGWMIFENIHNALVDMWTPASLSSHGVWQVIDKMMDEARGMR